MQKIRKDKTIIGRAEKVYFPELGDAFLHARVDTGAKTSSIWASEIKESNDGLSVRLASPEHEINKHELFFKHYDRVRVSSSMGHSQIRYKVKIKVILGGRKVNAKFTLSDRSTQVYPILIGRSILLGKFIVDVEKGSPLRKEEKIRSDELQKNITEERI